MPASDRREGGTGLAKLISRNREPSSAPPVPQTAATVPGAGEGEKRPRRYGLRAGWAEAWLNACPGSMLRQVQRRISADQCAGAGIDPQLHWRVALPGAQADQLAIPAQLLDAGVAALHQQA